MWSATLDASFTNEKQIIQEIVIDGAATQVRSAVIGPVCLHSNAMGDHFTLALILTGQFGHGFGT